MAYCARTDVESEFKSITFLAAAASPTSPVTQEDVVSFIDQVSAYIDGKIQNRYEVPVSGTASLLILKMVCILFVKARILSILSVKTPQDKNKQDPDGPTLEKKAEAMLDAIVKGTLELIDAEASNTDGGLTSYLKDRTIEYEFKMERDAW